ncbi:MAG TPA: redox-regulated ATPase YchF [Spirochaetaceae bacterium]|nr:redox-regulated ATPase YchF [Spirochaetaceae bacterium]
MPLNCGIVGLPNVGKSTIFSALSRTKAEAANYPFCTIDPNFGIVPLPDKRLDRLCEIFKPKRKVPAVVEFVDIAGLVRGASKGEGLGNQFLSHIREVGMIAHVVRCFDDPDVVHVAGRVDPADDIEVIHTELALADLESLDKRLDKLGRQLKVQDPNLKKDTEKEIAVLNKIRPALEEGRPAFTVNLEPEENEVARRSFLITLKKELFVCNVDESGVHGNAYVDIVKKIAEKQGSEAVVICGKFEAELADIEDPAERAAFLQDIGLEEPALASLAHAAYRLLGLRTFFTAGEDECRAWTIRAGDRAPTAAGVIHSDFEKGFIKAEVYHYDDLIQYGSEAAVRAAGKMRQEGRDYVVQDGDIMFFKFNV